MRTIIEPTDAQLQALVDPYLKSQPTGLAFAIGCASGSPPGFAKVYVAGSVINQYEQDLDLSPTTYFELGSLSKPFTATLCAFLGSKYNPTWETQTVGDYSTKVKVGPQFHPIPLLALANYTSGLPADNVSGAATLPEYLPIPYFPAAMLGFLNGTETLQPTQTSQVYTYSNLAFSTLAQIMPLFDAKTAAEALPELMAESVFGPLNMHNSAYFGDIFLDQLPVGYTYPTRNKVNQGHAVFPAYYGGGGVVSTPSDMLTWLQFNMGILTYPGLSVLLEKTQQPSTKVLRSLNIRMGLGWFLSELSPAGAGSVFKDGGLPGCETYMIFLSWVGSSSPSAAGVFVLINADGLMSVSGEVELAQSIAESVMNIMVS